MAILRYFLILNTNIQTIKVRFFPDIGNNMKLIPATSLAKQSAAIFTTENEIEKRIKNLILPAIKQDLPYYEQEWDFTANAIVGIDNLSQSQDHVKIDKAKSCEIKNFLKGD